MKIVSFLFGKKTENQIKDREERTVPLCELALNILHQVKNLNPHDKYIFSCKDKPVFNIKSQLKRAACKANLSKSVFPYMLRHTFAALFLKNGGSIYDLKVILGHSDISTTEKYLHTTASYLKNEIEKLNYLSSLMTSFPQQ